MLQDRGGRSEPSSFSKSSPDMFEQHELRRAIHAFPMLEFKNYEERRRDAASGLQDNLRARVPHVYRKGAEERTHEERS